MRARTGAMVLVGTAVVLLLVGRTGVGGPAMPADGGAVMNTNSGADGDIGGAGGGGAPAGAGGAAGEAGDGSAAGGDGARGDGGDAGGATPPSPGDDGRVPAAGAGGEAGARPASAAPAPAPAPAVRTVERERVLVLGSVFFASGRAELGPDARRLLDGVAATYKGTTQRLEITGHTDTRGSAAVNATLSRARAEAVRGYLEGRGVPAGQLVVRYAGASRPMARGASSEDNAQNRRVELSVATGR